MHSGRGHNCKSNWSDLSRTNWRLIETETDQRISLEDPGGALNVFLFVSGSSVYPRLETIPGSSSLYLLSVFDIFHKYLSKDSAQQLRAHLTSGKTSSNTRNSLISHILETVSIYFKICLNSPPRAVLQNILAKYDSFYYLMMHFFCFQPSFPKENL